MRFRNAPQRFLHAFLRAVTVGLLLLPVAPAAAWAGPPEIEAVSLAQGNRTTAGASGWATTPDGRYVAFTSGSDDLDPRDQDDYRDVYLRDLAKGTTELISVSVDGTSSGDDRVSGWWPSISDDGRYVAFKSYAKNLSSEKPGSTEGIFVRDRLLNTTFVANANAPGDEWRSTGYVGLPQISGNGRYVAFETSQSRFGETDTNGKDDVYVHDLTTRTTKLVSRNHLGTDSGAPPDQMPGGISGAPQISDDGRYIAFATASTDIVPDDTDQHPDVFLHDTETRVSTKVSRFSDGLRDNNHSDFSMTPSGSHIAFTRQIAGIRIVAEVYVWERATDSLTLASIAAGQPSNGYSREPSISDDGTKVAFTSDSTSLSSKDNDESDDIYLRDLAARRTSLVSVNRDGTAAAYWGSELPMIAGDGSSILFMSSAVDLTHHKSQHITDVYLRDLATQKTRLVSVDWTGKKTARSNSDFASINRDGAVVTYSTAGHDVVPWDVNYSSDIFAFFPRGNPFYARVGRKVTLTRSPSRLRFGQEAEFSGAIEGSQRCRADVPVVLYRQVKEFYAPIEKVRAMRTRPDGTFLIKVRPDASAVYAISVREDDRCRWVVSPTRSIDVAKRVNLNVSSTSVRKGRKVTFSATMQPCHWEDHRAEPTYLRQVAPEKKDIAAVLSSEGCKATFTIRPRRTAAYRVFSANQLAHDDHLPGLSRKVRVKVR